jgi:histone chaperone ASF1|mmetsp:Transcript_11995/g.27792  ORF Transcript_11995/g.27792 Transcript_11995/m.27792 type:complete len:171 (-) Transcript_11995:350-862(-)|eukprot:CAMPEP_0119373492 /NCGR_PEP_ID=MMETSP1334-20130426/25679_1 /TAXON_ID=127549 /ORGANISM="Calcidiscus leptoporus, Strain RCC1130" /LENGTH=170 /DNA_ID=CAMNT_0007391281 /DNA_START=92 /DNA_END=604 /DNA_ORIENTATION=+
MACVNVANVTVLDNPARFDNPFQFEITFEILEHLADDLEWKLVYVGSAESDEYDQEIDSVLVAPQGVGPYKFVFQGDAPDPRRIPPNDLLGVTVILLSCYYHEKEFIRVGYYVNTEYDTAELNEEPPEQPLYERLVRNILADKPRVTRYQIDWGNPSTTTPPPPTAMACE